MNLKTAFHILRRCAYELCTATDANVTITFVMLTVPLIGGVGAAVDYSRANSVKAAMQSAADATALMLAKEIGSTAADNAQINQKAYNYFIANLTNTNVNGVSVDANYASQNGSQITVAASGTVKSDFMSLLGISNMKVGVSSQSVWGSNAKMQVALALDNTGSMAEYNKMGSLKTATHSLLDQLKTAASNPGDVNVAIVPFSKDVNVGATTSNIVASWIDWSDWENDNGTDVSTQTCTKMIGRKGKPTNRCVNSTTWVPASHATWNGCITDRDQDFDVSNTAPKPGDKQLPATSASTLFPADQYNACPTALMGLTNDWVSLNNKVDQMAPNGTTNQAIGLAWAWQALTSGQPMNAPGKGPNVQQIIILLTDGLNTEDRWYSDEASINARQQTLCSNIKSAGITLYTIQVNIGRIDPVSTLLQQCASKPEYFYLLTSAGEIASVFNQIGTKVSALRLAH